MATMTANNPINARDLQRLRALAQHQAEVAASDKNLQRVELWKRHNACRGERPPIHIEVGTFAHQVVTPQLTCEDPFARSLEYELIKNCVNQELFDDDWVIPPYFQMGWDSHFRLFGHTIRQDVLTDEEGTELGHKFQHIISDLETDFDKILSPTEFGVDKAATLARKERMEDIFGDILPVKIVSGSLYAVPTQQVVHLMGLENMIFSIWDYPELFRTMMDRIADSYIDWHRYLETEGLLKQTHSFEWLGQGSLCFFDEEAKEGPILASDLWGFLDSQETVGMSPDMFHEFIFPCYERLAKEFGRLSYGCCEPVHTFWEDIKTLPNLKKVSISPWCDEEFMASELRGRDIIYHRKPSPNYLGLDKVLDEDAFRSHIEKTLLTARGCHLEITQRDVYTIHHDLNKVRRYVQLIRQSIDRCWRP